VFGEHKKGFGASKSKLTAVGFRGEDQRWKTKGSAFSFMVTSLFKPDQAV